jgi:hypothetical protein
MPVRLGKAVSVARMAKVYVPTALAVPLSTPSPLSATPGGRLPETSAKLPTPRYRRCPRSSQQRYSSFSPQIGWQASRK